MRKTIYLLNLNNYAPELTAMSYPSIFAYADRIHANVDIIEDRMFPDWPITYEKLQIYERETWRRNGGSGSDWILYIDSDALIHPELVDITEMLPRDTIAHNGKDWSPVRFELDDYGRRDGRGIGSCNWFTVASSWCLDLWRPLELEPAEAIARIHPTMEERTCPVHIEPEHLIDDFALSNNIARFGLKFTTFADIWREHGLVNPGFFHHDYTYPLEDYEGKDPTTGEDVMLPGKVSRMKICMASWGM